MKKLIKGIATAIAATYLTLMPAKADAFSGTAEIAAGQEYTSLDARLNAPLGEKGGLFVWNIASVDYDGKGSNFSLLDLSYNLVGGLGVVLENQFIGDYGYARAGLQYYGEKNDFNAFFLATAGTPFDTFEPSGELTAIIGYNPKFNGGLGLHARIEDITNFGGSHNFSIQRLRLGLSIDKFRFGASADFMETGNEGEFSHNVGGFVGVDF